MEMNFKDGIILPTKALRKCGPYLEKYFGITLGYFNVELEKFRYEGSASYAIQKDQDICFPLRNLNFKAYLQDVDGPMLPIPLGDVALLVAYIIMDRKYPEEAYPESLDSDDREWDDIYQNDWSKLLVFIDEILQREENSKKSRNTSITIRTNDGLQDPLEIENSGNWFFRLIKKEFASYFNIKTPEEARQDLLRQKPSVGAKKLNPIYDIVIYGFYRMLHEENVIPEKPDIPNELCELIYKFTTFTGCYPKEKTKDDIFNPKRIRADISHIKKKVSIFGESYIPKFSPIELSSVRYMTQDICPRSLD